MTAQARGHAPFDERASNYHAHVWHVQYAERLIELARLPRGAAVLDVATGTGLAARAAARCVGDGGRVVGVDISRSMLDEARALSSGSEFGHLTFELGDATSLCEFGADSFDSVLCSAALLYMPVERALQAWRRVLRPGGVVGFSTMACGVPPAAQLFRDCARDVGVTLRDPSASLGTQRLCREALEQAGFRVREVVPGRVEFTAADLGLAWEANLRTAGHEQVSTLRGELTQKLEDVYRARVSQAMSEGDSLRYADVFYAFGTV